MALGPGPRSARALAASIEAAGQAERMRAPADAARHLENARRALGSGADAPSRRAGRRWSALLRRAAELTYLAGDVERAAALGQRMLELIGDSDPVAAGDGAASARALPVDVSGRHREAAEEYARAVELMPAEPPSAERANVLASLAQVLMLQGRPAPSRASSPSRRSRSPARPATGAWRRTRSTRWAWTSRRSGDRARGSPTCASRSRSRRVLGHHRQPAAHVHQPVGPPRPGRLGARRAWTSRWRASGSPASRG